MVIDLKVGVKWALEQFDLSDEALSYDKIEKLEEDLDEAIHGMIAASLEKGQKKLGCDVFNFGNVFFRQHTKEWNNIYEKKWDEIFPDIKVNIDVQSRIMDTGLAIRPMERQ